MSIQKKLFQLEFTNPFGPRGPIGPSLPGGPGIPISSDLKKKVKKELQ